ncbi:MAG: hypothetical protein LBR73_07590 [Oscillospiraceae bacterium]|jgi:nucleotide sugar dehydrogenase|nr:hypothetical protein [Oscillospiraceae bacterium]
MSKKIAVIGHKGYVGRAFAEFAAKRYELVCYDIAEGVDYPKVEIDACALAAVCVPTPPAADGSCDTFIVEDAISKIDCPLILIKSTVAPGTTERLRRETGKRIVFSPEYIGESKYYNPVYKNMSETNFLICGGEAADVTEVFTLLEPIAGPYSTYHACTSTEAEIIKYMVNSFLATKVAFVNEFYDIAQAYGADWHRVREGWLLDERIGRSFSAVFAEDRGFGGKCLPKDTQAIVKAAADAGYESSIVKAVVAYNRRLRGDMDN